ncbi:hypothetical protein [Pontibaca methylaminivorans]|uniref:hypothetical protein n=1 Tax=Pontibaca methylaminivorans TaxID=515897 RepID=UPI002FDA507A
MEIVFHPGVHHTEEDRLMKSLLRNKDDFHRAGVSVPGPGRYRTLLKETFRALETGPLAEGAREVLLDAILDQDQPRRLVLSNPHFFGSPRLTLDQGRLYPLAAQRMAQMRAAFGPDHILLFMAIRNPAALLPALLGKCPADEVEARLGGRDPRELRWSDVVMRIRDAVPEVAITLWCSEDAPLVWGRILRAFAGLPDDAMVAGETDLLGAIISEAGMTELRSRLRAAPAAEREEIMAGIMERHALEDRIHEELDLPGWTPLLVEEMSALYEADMERLKRMPDLQIIAPCLITP